MRILALDQSTTCVGYACIDTNTGELIAHGAQPIAGDTVDERISQVKRIVLALSEELAPDSYAIEDIQFQNNYRTYKVLAELMGVLTNAYYERGDLYIAASPSAWKAHIGIKARDRRAQKAETIAYVTKKYGFTPTEDEADAIGIAEYAAAKQRTSDITHTCTSY